MGKYTGLRIYRTLHYVPIRFWSSSPPDSKEERTIGVRFGYPHPVLRYPRAPSPSPPRPCSWTNPRTRTPFLIGGRPPVPSSCKDVRIFLYHVRYVLPCHRLFFFSVSHESEGRAPGIFVYQLGHGDWIRWTADGQESMRAEPYSL